MVFLITYDLRKPGQNYSALYEAIKKLGISWYHPLDSTWFVASGKTVLTSLTANSIVEELKKYIDKSDRLFVCKVPSDYQGFLEKEFWEWLRQNLF